MLCGNNLAKLDCQRAEIFQNRAALNLAFNDSVAAAEQALPFFGRSPQGSFVCLELEGNYWLVECCFCQKQEEGASS